MKNLKLILAVLFFCAGISANAQVSKGFNYGIKAGANYSSFYGDGVSNDLDGKIGFHAGFFIENDLMNNLYLLSGLELTTKGGMVKNKEGDFTEKVTFDPMYIQLPVHIGYKSVITSDMALGIHAGPYLAYGIGGKRKEVEKEGKEILDKNEMDFFGKEDEKNMNMKPFDAGVGIGLDFDYKQFRIGAGYDLGLMNMSRSKEKEFDARNCNFFVSVGYKF